MSVAGGRLGRRRWPLAEVEDVAVEVDVDIGCFLAGAVIEVETFADRFATLTALRAGLARVAERLAEPAFFEAPGFFRPADAADLRLLADLFGFRVGIGRLACGADATGGRTGAQPQWLDPTDDTIRRKPSGTRRQVVH